MDKTNETYYLEIASEIMANGRIEDPEDWEEMKIELQHEFNEHNLSQEHQEEGLQAVKRHWY